MAHINIIQPEQAEGRLKEIYDDLIQSRGKLAEVHKIQSLNPESIVGHMELYMTIMFGRSPLKRVQREIIAVVVSKANDCEYCQIHHSEAVNHYWKNEERIALLKNDFYTAGLSESEELLCEFAFNLTRTPNWNEQENQIEKLKQAGLEDRAILDATLVISYFNFVNRMVLGLGVHIEENAGVGFKYD